MESDKKTITDIVKSYTRYLKLERNYSPNTLAAYQNDLSWLLSFCEQQEMNPLDMQLEDLQHFAVQLHEHQIGPTSQARILSGIRSFYKYLLLSGEIVQKSIDLSKPEGQRNKTIIEVLFSCGLRVSELVNLKLSNLYLEEGFVRVMGKGSKERLVPISSKAIRELKYWFLDRNLMKIQQGEEDYVFLNRRGKHLTRTMILIMLKRQAVAAGITKTISPHTLRHSFATELLKGGADLRAIQAMLGHESIGTTELYMHIDTTTLREEILQHHPRNMKEKDDDNEEQEDEQ